jgi:hypothetical protein
MTQAAGWICWQKAARGNGGRLLSEASPRRQGVRKWAAQLCLASLARRFCSHPEPVAPERKPRSVLVGPQHEAAANGLD